jgi:hypothetical protein
MTARVLSWVPRNKVLQADIPLDHFAAGVTAAEGWQVVVEWRWRADPGDDWSAPTIHIKTPPELSSSYEPPGAGWVQVKSFSIQGGRTSRQALVREFPVDAAGEVINPARYVDEDGNPYVDDSADNYYDA